MYYISVSDEPFEKTIMKSEKQKRGIPVKKYMKKERVMIINRGRVRIVRLKCLNNCQIAR